MSYREISKINWRYVYANWQSMTDEEIEQFMMNELPNVCDSFKKVMEYTSDSNIDEAYLTLELIHAITDMIYDDCQMDDKRNVIMKWLNDDDRGGSFWYAIDAFIMDLPDFNLEEDEIDDDE